MRRLIRQSWLPTIIVLAALAAESPAFGLPTGQITFPEPTSPSAQAAAQAPAAVPAAQSVSAPAAYQPTPEELGDSLFGHQRYQAAIEAYKKDPHPSADVWNKLGISYQMMFNLDDAAHCYRMSLKLNPKNSHVLNNLGTIYDSQKDFGEAERMYRKAIKFDPTSALIYKNLGTSLLSQHKYKKGWEFYKAALTIDPHIFESSDSPHVDNPASVEDRGAMNYFMARGCVRVGMNACAIEYLRMALNEGFISPRKVETDSEFAGLRGLPAFQQLLAAQRRQ
jgi:tetratricopeptide (TPR) repeat protein